MNRGHLTTDLCDNLKAKGEQTEAAIDSALSLRQIFTAYEEELERVEVFKYLGRLLAYDDTDVQAVQKQLRKARSVWQRFSRLLRSEKATPRVAGKFYKAVVMSILLFGSETWNITPTMMKVLEGFHIQAAWRMAREHKPRRDPQSGTWTYPCFIGGCFGGSWPPHHRTLCEGSKGDSRTIHQGETHL